MSQKYSVTHKVALFSWHLLWQVPIVAVLGLIIWFFIFTYYNSELNSHTSAKPEARKILASIKKDNGLVIHEYNRTAGGFPGTISVPSYEYYIEFEGASIAQYTGTLAKGLEELGYNVQYAKFIYKDSYCTKYGYGRTNVLPDGRRVKYGDEETPRQYCQDISGITQPGLLGSTENMGEPYYTVYAKSSMYEVYAEISNKTFKVTSNDFWRDEYAKKYQLQTEEVRPGHTMMTITFTALKPYNQ